MKLRERSVVDDLSLPEWEDLEIDGHRRLVDETAQGVAEQSLTSSMGLEHEDIKASRLCTVKMDE